VEAVKAFLQGRWLGHPLHALLVHVPTALWPASLVFDLLALLGVAGPAMVRTAFYAILLGLVVALLAVPAGLADWSDIKPEKPARRLGLYHMLLNLLIWTLWAVNLAWRWQLPETAEAASLGAVLLSFLANGLLLISGYLGGRMVYDFGISVARVSKQRWRRVAAAGGARLPSEEQGQS
jgi:uncharacterized membrane protein